MQDIAAEGDHGKMRRQPGCPALSSAGPRPVRPVSAGYCRLVAHPEVSSLTSVVDVQRPVEPRPPTRARHWSPYLAVVGLLWAIPGGLLLVGYLALPDHITSSQCDGSAFGCTLTPKDGTVVLAIYVYPLLVVMGWLIMAVIAMGRAWRHRSRRLTRKVTARRCATRHLCQHLTTEQVTAMLGIGTSTQAEGLRRGCQATGPAPAAALAQRHLRR